MSEEKEKVVVVEVVLPDFDAEELERALAEEAERVHNAEGDTEPVPLRVLLGLAGTDVMVNAMVLEDEPCENCGEYHEHLDGFRGYVVRARVSDMDWVQATADEPV